MEVKLLECGSEEIVLRAIARSHGNDIAKPEMIAKVIEWGHTSVLEHWTAVFDINGISRSCLQQLVRHRIGMSYTVRSQRYCNEAGSDFYLPKLDYLSERNKTQVKQAMQVANGHMRRLYNDMLVWDVKQEDARYILPEATHTSLILTANARALRHFFELRMDKSAQAEIRKLAGKMFELVGAVATNIFQDGVKEWSKAERLLIKVLKKYADDICYYCKNEVKCKDKKCEHYVEGVGDAEGKYPNMKWSCVDFEYGTCSVLENTPCNGCFENDYKNFEWHGREKNDT